jgi:hypothetical protein
VRTPGGGRLAAVCRRLACAGIFLAAVTLGTAAFRPPDERRVPVLVELFTSEGCSDCPPADRLLKELATQQPVDRARIVILSEHVDYFNHDGWTDPFSRRLFTDRQSAYDAASQSSGPFTPEMIVDGRIHFVGSDRQGALAAIRTAAGAPKPALRLSWQSLEPLVLDLAVDAGVAAASARVYVAVTEDGLISNVRDGENKGRQLSHDGVARQLTQIGATDRAGRFQRAQPVKIDKGWRGPVRTVAIVQKEAGAVIAVGTLERSGR